MICMYYKMEVRIDTATTFALSIIIFVFSAVDVNADIPDNVVYTDVRKIVIEGDDAVLKCQFLGTPLAVYWKEGSDPKSAPNLITWFGDEPPTGSCVEDGACEMADDFSLILKEVEMEDQGRYICRVSNHYGILIYNFTDVKVIDPDQLSIDTEPYVVGWAGSSISLPCNFTVDARKVIWERVYWDGGSKVETILRYTSDGHEAPAARRYSWSENYGLIIRGLHVSDEGNFTCLVSSIDGIEIKNSTVLVVNVETVFSPGSATESTTVIIVVVFIIVMLVLVLFIFVMIRTRQYKSVTNDYTTGAGYKKIIGDWFCWVFCWKKPYRRIAATEMEAATSEMVPVAATEMEAVASTEKEAATEMEADKGMEAVVATENKAATTEKEAAKGMGAVAATKNKAATTEKEAAKGMGAVAATEIEAATSEKEAATEMQAQTEQAELPVDAKMDDDKERQGLQKKLNNLREQLKKYQPGNATELKRTEGIPSKINLGVFGIMGVGKSSLINSIKYAFTDNYEEVAVVADHAASSTTMFRDPVCLTEHINILDNRGMKNFSVTQVQSDLMPQIRGERGLDPDDQITNGDVIHCPIFVHDISTEHAKPEDVGTFLSEFSSAVLRHYGRHMMVVFTHKDKAEDSESLIFTTMNFTTVPGQNIWSFQNYTEDNKNRNVGKSIRYLKFLEECLKIGERNICFRMQKSKEVRTGWCTIQ